jgi:hypothetical protein
MPDPIAVRVARRHAARHQAAVFPSLSRPNVRVEYTNHGRISAADLKKMLEPQVGRLKWLAFRPPVAGSPVTIRWEALAERAELVAGTLTLRSEVSDHQVTTWAEVEVDPEP